MRGARRAVHGNNIEVMAELKAVTGTHGLAAVLADARVAVVKRAKAVALLPVVAALIAFGVVSMIPDRYAAVVLVQVDPWQKPASSTGSSEASPLPPFEAQRQAVAQQIETLTSPALLDTVVKSQALASDAEFQTRPAIAWMTAPFTKSDAEAVAREALAARLTVRRVHNSSLIKLEVWSRDAAKAAKIANAVAAQYIGQKLTEASSGGAKPASAEPTASEKVFASLLNEYGLTSTLTGSRIVENAQTPKGPAGPKRVRIVGGAALATLALVLGLAMLLERDTRLRTRKVEQMLACRHMTSLPTVAVDDHVPTSARRARLIIAEPGCRYADAVRAACDALAARPSGDGGRVILTASALPGEGAELFASNIAHHLAVAGQKTLLIDCDFQNKVLTRELAPQSPAGLLDQLAAQAPVENVILRDSLTGVHFLAASGATPPSSSTPVALRSVAFAAAFQHLKARFQTIVVSAPPLLESDDGQALADLADQIVFLTAWHRTPRSLAKKAVALLESNQRKIAGAVLADIGDDRDAGFMSFAAMFDEIRRAARIPTLDRAA